MFWEGISDQIILVSLVEAYDTVTAYEFSTGLTVDLQDVFWVFWAVHDLLCWRDKVGCLVLNNIEASYLVGAEFFPCFVNFGALVTDKLATVTAESCCQRLFTFLTLCFLWLFCFQ